MAADFPAVPAPVTSVRGEEPLQVGVIGPPGSGKTRSLLRLMRGVQRVRKGPIVLIDTEGGRSKKYSPKPGEAANPDHPISATYDFKRIDLDPPFRSDRCLEAIRQALKINPAAIGFDSLSDEHEGEGGYLEWHDQIIAIPKGQPGYIGGNEWAAWSKPAAARKRLASALLQIKVPLFFTFRATEKTKQVEEGGKKKIVNIGWVPVAPLQIVKGLDLTCILPYDSKGTPIWRSRELSGEDFIRKWPDHLLDIVIEGQLTEDTGERLARWALGETLSTRPEQSTPPAAAANGVREQIDALVKRHLTPAELKGERLWDLFLRHFGTRSPKKVMTELPEDVLNKGYETLRAELDGLAEMRAEREPGEEG